MTHDAELALARAIADQGRTDEAVAILQRLAQAGHADSLFTLGDLYWRGVLVAADMPLGRRMIAMAAERGNAMAGRATTNLIASGVAGPRDWKRALARLQAEALGDQRRRQMLALIGRMALDSAGNPARLPEGRQLSEAPHVTLFPGAFTAEECAYLRMVAEPAYEESHVVNTAGDGVRDAIRTSDGSTFHWVIEDPATHALNRRLAALSGTHVAQGEALQILRYRPGQQYRRHVDWIPGDPNPRILTALAYLNEDYEGGETEFAKVGLKVKGGTGDVLVFRNAGADGKLDPLTEHAGLPVVSGIKYLGSRWIRADRNPAYP